MPAPFPQLEFLTKHYQKELSLSAAEVPIFSRDVWPEFALALLTDPNLGGSTERRTSVPRFSSTPSPQALPAYTAVVDLYQQWVTSGQKPDAMQWKDAIVAANIAYSAASSYAVGVRAATASAAANAVSTSKDAVRCVMFAASCSRNAHPISQQFHALRALAQPLVPSVSVEL